MVSVGIEVMLLKESCVSLDVVRGQKVGHSGSSSTFSAPTLAHLCRPDTRAYHWQFSTNTTLETHGEKSCQSPKGQSIEKEVAIVDHIRISKLNPLFSRNRVFGKKSHALFSLLPPNTHAFQCLASQKVYTWSPCQPFVMMKKKRNPCW